MKLVAYIGLAFLAYFLLGIALVLFVAAYDRFRRPFPEDPFDVFNAAARSIDDK